MSEIAITDVLFIAGVVILLVRRLIARGGDLNDPFLWFLFGTSVFLSLGSLRDQAMAMGIERSRASEWKVHLLQWLHVLCVWGGYVMVKGSAVSVRSALRGWAPQRTWLVGLMLVTIFLRLTVFDPRRPLFLSESNYLNQLALLPVACAGVTAAVVVILLSRSPMQWLPRVSIYVCLSLLTIALCFYYSRTPLMYGSFVAGMCIFSDAVTYARRRGQEAGLRLLVLLVLPVLTYGVLTLGSAAKGYSAAMGEVFDVEKLETVMSDHRRNLAFIDAYENAIFAIDTFPSQQDYLWGRSYVAVVLGPVPRSVWPKKPKGFAEHLTVAKRGQDIREAGLSLATSLLGDLWAGGGWVNLILGSVALGGTMGWVTRWYAANRQSAAVKVIFWQFLFMCLLCQRGDIYIIFSRGLILMVLTYVCLKVAALRLLSSPVFSPNLPAELTRRLRRNRRHAALHSHAAQQGATQQPSATQ